MQEFAVALVKVRRQRLQELYEMEYGAWEDELARRGLALEHA